MTREEFNKLSQQERLDLVGKKWFGLYNKDKEYGWVIQRSYIKDKDGQKKLFYEQSWLNTRLPFEKYFEGLEVWLSIDKCGIYHICYKNNGLTFSIGTIPDGFLEEAYFMEIPKTLINEHVDEHSLAKFNPFEKQYKDYRSVEEIRKTKQYKMPIEDKTLDEKEIPINTINIKWFNNPKTLTKINIALICIASLITLINILVFL
jgi:hypothetical protein